MVFRSNGECSALKVPIGWQPCYQETEGLSACIACILFWCLLVTLGLRSLLGRVFLGLLLSNVTGSALLLSLWVCIIQQLLYFV